MDATFNVETVTRKGVTYVRLSGTLDHAVDPTSVADRVAGRAAIVDLGRLRLGTAGGARMLGELFATLGDAADRLFLVDCPRDVITELNLSEKLAARVFVASAQVRHVCRSCNSVTRVRYDISRGQEYGRRGIKTPCERCGRPTAADESLERYLAFRSHADTRPPGDELLAALDATDSALGEPGSGKQHDVELKQQPPRSEAQRGLAARWSRLAVWQRLALAGGLLLVLGGGTGVVVAVRSEPPAVTQAKAGPTEAKLAAIRTRVLDAFQEGRYADVIDEVEDLSPADLSDVPVAFAVGESYRYTNRLADAGPYYAVIIDAPDPGRTLDDAIFWRAESLLLNGDKDAAVPLFERVIALKRSNFVKSAKRRLAEIRRDR